MLSISRSVRFVAARKTFANNGVAARLASNYIVAGDNDAVNKVRENSSKKIFYFTASWCPPCRKIGPVFESLSKIHPTINFVKIDVDQFPDISAEFNVRSVPTFFFISGQTKIAEFSGALESELVQKIGMLAEAK